MKLSGSAVEVFAEKPNHADKFINGGFFVFDQRIFDYVSDATDCSLERDCLKNVATDGELMMFRHEGFWQCLDTQRDLVQFQKLLSTGKAPWLTERSAKSQSPVPATMFQNKPINFAPPA